jgi:hypothetical protein
MAKRFIDTNFWRSPFVRSLPQHLKTFYLFTICDCAHTGLWIKDFEAVKLYAGVDVSEREFAEFFISEGKAVEVKRNVYFFPDFIEHQYGTGLHENNRAHVGIINELQRHNIDPFTLKLSKPFEAPCKPLASPLQGYKDKEKDMEKEKEKEKGGGVYKNANEAIKLVQANDCAGAVGFHSEAGESAPEVLKSALNGKNEQECLPPKPIKGKKRATQALSDFTACMQIYSEWYAQFQLPLRITNADGKALKELIAYFDKLEAVKAGNKTTPEVWQYVLNNWAKLDAWQQKQIELRQINSRITNIIEQIKANGKQTTNTGQVADLAKSLRNIIDNSKAV